MEPTVTFTTRGEFERACGLREITRGITRVLFDCACGLRKIGVGVIDGFVVYFVSCTISLQIVLVLGVTTCLDSGKFL